MPRIFVNGVSNFSIQGGLVRFTLHDQALRNEGGTMRPGPAEPAGEFVMRVQDFERLLEVFGQNYAAFRQQAGGQGAGGPPAAAPAARPGQPLPPFMNPGASPAAKPAAAQPASGAKAKPGAKPAAKAPQAPTMRIRPKS
ncbi:MAG: hypothetical protein AAF074_06875 [Pseudomonadota bacterium]